MTQQNQLAQLDALARLHALPDAAALTTSEAAIFLRSSVSALESMRAKGTGPTYIQGGGQGALGANQKCLYEKADLLAWMRSNKVHSTVEAAVRKGQLFMSLFDLAAAEAFWIDGHGRVVGMVEAAPVATAVERLGRYEIVWLSAVNAGARPWSDLAAHRSFAENVFDVLQSETSRVKAGLEATEMATASEPSTPSQRGKGPQKVPKRRRPL